MHRRNKQDNIFVDKYDFICKKPVKSGKNGFLVALDIAN